MLPLLTLDDRNGFVFRNSVYVKYVSRTMDNIVFLQGVPRGKTNILVGYSMGHSKQKCVYVRVLFRKVSEIEPFHCTVPKLLIRRRYYVLFLISVFIVQVTKLVQFTLYSTFSKIPPSTSMHSVTRVRTAHSIFGICEDVRHFHNTPTMSQSAVTTANWRFTPIHMREGRAILDDKSKLLHSEIAVSRKPFGIGHMFTYTFFCLEWPILRPPRTLTFHLGTICISKVLHLTKFKKNYPYRRKT
jgi:hypothetical protein